MIAGRLSYEELMAMVAMQREEIARLRGVPAAKSAAPSWRATVPLGMAAVPSDICDVVNANAVALPLT